MEKDIRKLTTQNEIAQLDREWALERESYLLTGRYGSRYIPRKSRSVWGGILLVTFGILWTVGAFAMTGAVRGFFFDSWLFRVFPWFGVLVTLFASGFSIYSFNKARQYETAQQTYQHRRRELQARSNGP